MAPIELPCAPLFDGFPEPVFLLRDGAVRYYNRAAARLFPGLEPECPAPETLLGLLKDVSAPALAAAKLEGDGYLASVQETSEGLLLMLRPEPEEGRRPRLDRLAVELRQETAGLSAALQMLDPDRVELQPERARQYLSAANRGLYCLLRLCDHLEFLDRPDGDAYHPGAMDLAGFLAKLMDEVSGLMGQGGWHFRYETELSSLITVADADLLRRLVLGLVSNAVKAAGPGGELGVRLAKAGRRAVLTVWDSGEGLSGEQFGRLFDAGAAPKGTGTGEGLGLGLSAVRRAAALHGGTLMVDSRPGGGTRATVALPLREPEGSTTLRGPGPGPGGFSAVLIELADVLPITVYCPEDLE